MMQLYAAESITLNRPYNPNQIGIETVPSVTKAPNYVECIASKSI